ncbi:MAG: bifunctional adenosylcobinamide kinase/adenosylcobinamide-phosphate guanylyltransferase [Firmicutes bacterium]|nr:bifunctional adenosylcobinamide kinase/adenosylcobinamide-phosphate guanylyltransferase [Bacillota bacterium]
MDLIIGGAYQGKLLYAKRSYGLTDAEIFFCKDAHIDFRFRCIYGIEEFVYACVTRGDDPIAVFQAQLDAWRGSILICRDIFCGVVPLSANERAWREQTGWLCQYLATEAAHITRIYCGLEERLK